MVELPKELAEEIMKLLDDLCDPQLGQYRSSKAAKLLPGLRSAIMKNELAKAEAEFLEAVGRTVTMSDILLACKEKKQESQCK